MEKKYLTKVYFKNDTLNIPLYQRAYEWKIENCNLLFDDLLKAANETSTKRNHFFGSIIALLEEDKPYEMAIIDGQQRITTIALLLTAIRDVLLDENCNIISEDRTLAAKIDRVLKDQDDDHIFLKPVEKDREAYEALIRSKINNRVENSNITINYLNFVELLKKNINIKTTIDSFYAAINSLYVMPIFLTHEDDAQAVFESINSTGLGLYESDKIRNYVLMNHPLKIQNQYYHDYWSKYEKNVDDITTFFRHYLIVTTTQRPKLNDVYRAFKNAVNQRLTSKNVDETEKEEAFEDMLEEILRYSCIYRNILDADFGSKLKTASMYMRHINYLELTVTYPFIMKIIWEYNEHRLDEQTVTAIFEILDNYLIRHVASGKYSTGLNGLFASLYRAIDKLNSDAPFVEKFKYVLLHKEGPSAYVTDAVLKQKLNETDLYRKGENLVADLILATLEDANRDTADTLSRIKNNELSIEHIMPQTLTDKWIEMLGTDYQNVYESYIHKLGNLTLTAYNSDYHNKPFNEKQTCKNGFKDSRLYLNGYVADQTEWTQKQIIERQNNLINRFLKLIPELKTDCKLKTENEVEYTLDEEPEMFTGVKVTSFTFEDATYQVSSMTEVLKKMTKMLFNKNPKMMMDIAEQHMIGTYISNEPFQDSDTDYVISDNVHIFTRSSNYDKISLLSNIIGIYKLNPEEISISGIKQPPRSRKSPAE